MKKESFKEVEKVWGQEIWLVNRAEYCAKLLILNRNAESSYHAHEKKTETFWPIEGYAVLTVEGKEYTLAPFARPKTIEPGEKHKFRGVTEAIILEVSTTHDDSDVVRFSESKPGHPDTEGGTDG